MFAMMMNYLWDDAEKSTAHGRGAGFSRRRMRGPTLAFCAGGVIYGMRAVVGKGFRRGQGGPL
ncbi:hypothetical protein DQ384_13345 [Sphaerisporangium album]|uniref:Uncharacterized protein n=1 Tax=Sphaerisporangium album TaxID=509200 RepID=A0A367FKW0_9ACTN|nr:hypothetical protein DQ384_13345 [Sphaerisporangium album]